MAVRETLPNLKPASLYVDLYYCFSLIQTAFVLFGQMCQKVPLHKEKYFNQNYYS